MAYVMPEAFHANTIVMVGCGVEFEVVVGGELSWC